MSPKTHGQVLDAAVGGERLPTRRFDGGLEVDQALQQHVEGFLGLGPRQRGAQTEVQPASEAEMTIVRPVRVEPVRIAKDCGVTVRGQIIVNDTVADTTNSLGFSTTALAGGEEKDDGIAGDVLAFITDNIILVGALVGVVVVLMAVGLWLRAG